MRILVVEDYSPLFRLYKVWLTNAGPVADGDIKAWRRTIEARLRKARFEIEFVLDGDKALRRYCERGPYDLLLTDFVHPGLNGLELINAIRERNPAQAAAMLTGGIPDSVKQSLQRLRAPVLYKPFRGHKLTRLVESVTKPQLRILLVAGDPAVKPLTAAYTSFELELEFTGNKALKHYRKHGPYDMVVTGYNHRGLNGVGLTIAIRRVNSTQRIAMITGESDRVVRSIRRKLGDIPVLKLNTVIKSMLKIGRARMSADRARTKALPSWTRKRIEERMKDFMDTAFFELEDGGAQALLTLVEFAMKLQQEKIAPKLPRDSCTTVHGLR